MTGDEKTHYEVLGIAPDASTEEVKRTARKLMQTHHPDLGGDSHIASQINNALDVLADPEKRTAYDEFLRTGVSDDEPEAPDPDAFEDAWGAEEEWEPSPGDDEEVFDVEVEEEPAVEESEPAPVDADDIPVAASDPPPTKVRTALWSALVFGLLPTVGILLAIIIESYILTTPPDSPFLFPAFGLALGIVFSTVLRKRLPEGPAPRSAIATMIAVAVVVVSLGVAATSQPQLVPGAQAFLASAVGTWLFVSGAERHRQAEQIIKSKGLRQDGTIFGSSTGDTAGELLNATIWGCLAKPEFHAARGFQTADNTNPFTKAILLGNRVALLRPIFLPQDAIPHQNAVLYWSSPSLFINSDTTVPVPLLRLELDAYRSSFRGIAGNLKVQEFLVIYTHPDSPAIEFPAEQPGTPTVVYGRNAAAPIQEFLFDAKHPVHHVDHQSATGTLLGLEYQAMHS